MRLHSFRIHHFRSIETAVVNDCGGFNVLIGKNNSGKSTVLSALSVFFECLSNGNVVSAKPPIGAELDFHDRNQSKPIEITMRFHMDTHDRDRLLQQIVQDAPRVKHAAESLPQDMVLCVVMTVVSEKAHLAFISSISVSAMAPSLPWSGDGSSSILTLDEAVAVEIYESLVRVQRLDRDLEAIADFSKQIDSETWNAFQTERETELARPRASRFGRYLFNRLEQVDIAPELVREISGLVQRATSQEDFDSQIAAVIGRIQAERAAAESEPLQGSIRTFAGDEHTVPAHIRELMSQLSAIKVLYLTDRRQPIGAKEASQLLRLKVTRGGPDRLRAIQQTVSALLGVEVDAFQAEGVQRPSPLSREPEAELDVDKFVVQANGSGIREALRLVLDYEFNRPALLLVEEPETHLHPALETAMMRYLQDIGSECQIFITTHSTNFLDSATMSNVYLLKNSGSTEVDQLDVDSGIASIPQELGIRPSSLFMYDKLVLVEGRSDEEVIRAISLKLGMNLTNSSVGFIPLGGVSNFAHFANREVMSFLTRRMVEVRFILDRDERDESDIERLESLLGENCHLSVLKRREIENYLLIPDAIIEMIKKKWQSNPSASSKHDLPSEAEIEMIMQEEADRLRNFVINKRLVRQICKPVYPKSISSFFETKQDSPMTTAILDEIDTMIQSLYTDKDRVNDLFTAIETEVDSEWAARKLSLVPGDVLLDAICQRFDVRFRKERDSGFLASLITASKIDPEITRVVREIGS